MRAIEGRLFNRDVARSAALAHHHAGRLSEAEELYRAMLAADPADAEALHLSGVAADAQGRPAEGEVLIRRALAFRETASYRSNLGMVLGHLGRQDEALAEYARALILRPGYPEALNNQGVALDALRRLPQAEAAYRAAILARPGYAEALCNLGNLLRAQNRTEDALAAYHAALAGEPGAVSEPPARPDRPEVHTNMGQVLLQLGRFSESVAACERALSLRPDMPEALTNLGHALCGLNRMAEAEAALRRALALRPADVNAYNNLAVLLQTMDRDAEALAVLDLAIGLDPDDPESRHHRAMLHLRAGRFASGWADYEWRLRIRQAGDSYRQFAGKPVWKGEPLGGRTLLLLPEQGLGDTIQFARYAAVAAGYGGRIVLGVPKPLMRLFGGLAGVDQLVAVGEALPPVDLHRPLLSLPGMFGTTSDSIPGPHPYLHAEPDAVRRWAARIGTDRPGLRVGLVWAGNPDHVNDRQRSIPFEALTRLWSVPGVRWFGLQVGPRAADAAGVAHIEDLSPDLTDFAETAAAAANLDLVIAVDTSTAHLAGALGRPVWVLLPRTPDWRWLRTGSTTPWYPSARLFRQDATGSWTPVVAAVAQGLSELTGLAAARAPARPEERLILFQWAVASGFGWGVYGLHMLLGWADRPGFRPASLQEIHPAQLDLDPVERDRIAPALARSATVLDGLKALAGRTVTSGHLVLHALTNGMVRGKAAHGVDVRGTPEIGVAFLETADTLPGAAERLRGYELVVAGSAWNRRLLEEAGSPRVELVLQGVDTSLFHPAPRRSLFPGRFVVFSGGKLEFRKGQDLVVQAFRIFAERHPEALLMTAWSSPWPEGALSLDRNPTIMPPTLLPSPHGGGVDVAAWTARNGIDPHQVRHLGPVAHGALARLLREADAALFPNRAEGGTNLVAMECMACGVPTIVSANTGHADLVGDPADPPRVFALRRQSVIHGAAHRDWGESDVDEILGALEQIHANRQEATGIGLRGAAFMAELDWARQVGTLGDLIQPFVG